MGLLHKMVIAMPGTALPLQVGGPTEFAKSMKKWLLGVLVFQVIVVACRFFFAMDVMGALIMFLQACAGGYAYQQDMNITYLCVYGIICAINCLFSTVCAIIPILINLASLDIGATISACLVPVANFAGAALVYIVYRDFDQTQALNAQNLTDKARGGMMGMGAGIGGFFGAGGSAGEAAPLVGGAAAKGAANANLFAGQGYTLGTAGGQQAGTAAQQFGTAASSAKDNITGSFAKLTGMGAPPVPAGRHDVTYDPFMTG